jgi:hypothetical protein
MNKGKSLYVFRRKKKSHILTHRPPSSDLNDLKNCIVSNLVETGHTIQKCQKMTRQNTFKILLLNDANMIGEH